MLFDPSVTYRYEPYPDWVDEYPDWSDPANAASVGERRAHDGWHWLNGSGIRTGRAPRTRWMRGARVLEGFSPLAGGVVLG